MTRILVAEDEPDITLGCQRPACAFSGSKLKKRIIVSTEASDRITDEGIMVMPVETFFNSSGRER